MPEAVETCHQDRMILRKDFLTYRITALHLADVERIYLYPCCIKCLCPGFVQLSANVSRRLCVRSSGSEYAPWSRDRFDEKCKHHIRTTRIHMAMPEGNRRGGYSSVAAGIDGAAVSIPTTLGATVIVYGSIGPQFLGPGVLAGCLAIVLMHALTAGSRRPLVFAARFFEAATLAAMVQQVGALAPSLGLPATAETRLALAISMVTLAGVVVGLLWLARAERFARFIPAPVYLGFSNSISVALLISQTKALHEQSIGFTYWPAVLIATGVFFSAVALRRFWPRWPAAAGALTAGGLLAAALTTQGAHVPMLMQGATWTLPIAQAQMANLWAPGVQSGSLLLLLMQNGLTLGVLLFLNTVVTGQMLAQKDDRQRLRIKDKLLQSCAMTLSGLAGAPPMSGSPNVALAVTRSSRLNATVLFTVAGATALLYASQALAWVPLSALVGTFLFDAWLMWDRPSARNLFQWLRHRKVSAHAMEDLVVILCVMAASLLINMVAALFVGLVLGLLLHAHRNTRKPVQRVLTGRQLSSNCARSRGELELLARHADGIRVFELDSNQFFVSAEQLNASVRSQLAGSEVAILDWSGVRSIDTSLAQMVQRLEAHARSNGVRVVHAGTQLQDETVHEILAQHLGAAQWAPDLDRALEWAENHLIHTYGEELPKDEESALEAASLLRQLTQPEQAVVLQHMEYADFAPGEPLVRKGDPSDCILLILQGTGSVIMPVDGQQPVRLAGVRSGTLVGEVGFLDGASRSATVVAETPLRAAVLKREAFDRLAHNHPRIVQRLLTNMSLDLASRLRKVSVQAAARNHNGMPAPSTGSPRSS